MCDEILGTGTSDAGREHLGNENRLWRRESIRTNLDEMIVMGRLMRRDEMRSMWVRHNFGRGDMQYGLVPRYG